MTSANTATSANAAEFNAEYLRTWIEPDADRRRAAIEELWAPEGTMSVSSLGVTVEGVEAIAAHIGHVHDEMIAGKGLRFAYDQEIQSGDATLLRWSMLAPNGETVGRGADLVFRDEQGRVTTVYMFMGVN